MSPKSLRDFKIRPFSVQRSAVQALRSAIVEGLFQPGDRLSEVSLCEMLGISRASVREALRSLESEKLIEMVPNRGPFVRVLTWEEAEDIYKVRALLESEAVSHLTGSVTEAQLDRLRTAMRGFDAAVASGDSAARVMSAGEFYDTIYEGSGNRIIQEVLTSLLARVAYLRHRSMSRSGRPEESSQEMKRILQAIEAGDAVTASKAARDHVLNACAAAKITFPEVGGAREVMEVDVG